LRLNARSEAARHVKPPARVITRQLRIVPNGNNRGIGRGVMPRPGRNGKKNEWQNTTAYKDREEEKAGNARTMREPERIKYTNSSRQRPKPERLRRRSGGRQRRNCEVNRQPERPARASVSKPGCRRECCAAFTRDRRRTSPHVHALCGGRVVQCAGAGG